MPIIDVYVAKIPSQATPKPVYPDARAQEIQACKNERVKIEKYCVWQLLAYALHRSYGVNMQKLPFAKDENGKWTTPDYFFSLSHCEEVVAVAISRKPVGLDVEKVSDRMEKIKDKILTQREFSRYKEREDKSLYLAEKWTQKESIFKMQGGKAFIPNKIETEDYKTHTARLKDLDGYLFSVAADEVKLVRTYQNVDVGYLL